MRARMQILVNIVTDQGLEADPDKIDTIVKFPTTGNNRQLQRLLTMANYVRQFCPHLRSVAAPLSELQGPTKHWKWIYLQDFSFEEVQALIMCNTSVKNFWHLDASVAAPECLIIFTSSRSSCSASWISFCAPALSSPCTHLPYCLRPVAPFSGPSTCTHIFLIGFPCTPVPALSSSATYITSLIFIA